MSDPSHDTPHYDPNFTGTPPTGYPTQLPFPPSVPYPSPLPAPYVPAASTSNYPTGVAVAVASYDPTANYDPANYDPASYDPSAAVPYDPNTSPYHPSLAPGYNSSSGGTYLQTLQDTTSPNDNDIEMKSNSSSTSEMLRAIREDIRAQRQAVNDLKVEMVSISKLMSKYIVDSHHSSLANHLTAVKSMESNHLLIRQMNGRDIASTATMAAAEAIANGMSKLSTQAPSVAQITGAKKGDLEDEDEDGNKDEGDVE